MYFIKRSHLALVRRSHWQPRSTLITEMLSNIISSCPILSFGHRPKTRISLTNTPPNVQMHPSNWKHDNLLYNSASKKHLEVLPFIRRRSAKGTIVLTSKKLRNMRTKINIYPKFNAIHHESPTKFLPGGSITQWFSLASYPSTSHRYHVLILASKCSRACTRLQLP